MNVLTPYDVDGDHDYREGRHWPWILLGVLLAVLLVFGAAGIWIKDQINPPGDPGKVVEIRVERGMSLTDVGKLLADKGVISSEMVFRYYSKLNGPGSVEAGIYNVRERESMGKVLDLLGGGAKSDEVPDVLTVAEGLTLDQIAEKVGELPGRSADRFLDLARSGQIRSQYQPAGTTNMEGLILPETYYLGKNDDEAAILRRMVESFDRTATSLNIVNAAARLNVTPYQAIIIASLVEREARVPEDRAPIARVIYNRLAVPMRLQIDATVLYALGEHKDTVLFKDLEVDSPYNTYKVDGLPPGPIATPGKAALEAALQPAPGPWLFYVLSETNGKHAFATTLDEFNRLVADARRRGVS